jgi:hypothetical protein
MKRRLSLVLAALVCTGAAHAGLDVPPAPATVPDLSAFATKSDVQQMQQAIPQPAMNVPPTEMIGGAAGTPGAYRPADARQPRITRSKTVILAADGTGTFDWTSQGALIAPVQVAIAPVYTGAGIPKCWVTAASATSASVKCVIETVSVLSIAGINVGSITNSAPASITVGVIVLPAS